MAHSCRISIHALRKEGDNPRVEIWIEEMEISIHALRKEGDLQILHDRDGHIVISIHALRKEGDSGNVWQRSPAR